MAVKRVELIGKDGKTRNSRVLDSTELTDLNLYQPRVFLPEQQARQPKERLARHVRQASGELTIQRCGVMVSARRWPVRSWIFYAC